VISAVVNKNGPASAQAEYQHHYEQRHEYLERLLTAPAIGPAPAAHRS